jgi:gas vesicle protein
MREIQETGMKEQTDVRNTRAGCSGYASSFGFMVAGLGIGAVLSVLFAPRSGEETLKWTANKCLDAAEAANMRVRDARIRVHEVVDQGQARVTAAIAVGRQASAKEEVAEQQKVI